MKTRLIDDGRKTYYGHKAFTWDGKTTETPFGVAAYVSPGNPERMATGRVGHPWFGNANGRTWAQLQPYVIHATPEACKYDINAQDIIEVNETLGGGYLSYGRHDMRGGKKTHCPLGSVFKVRMSNSEAFHAANDRPDVLEGHEYRLWDITRHWAGLYEGNHDFTHTTKKIHGTREQLKIAGNDLKPAGWTLDNNHDAVFEVTEELYFDNLGIIARRVYGAKRIS